MRSRVIAVIAYKVLQDEQDEQENSNLVLCLPVGRARVAVNATGAVFPGVFIGKTSMQVYTWFENSMRLTCTYLLSDLPRQEDMSYFYIINFSRMSRSFHGT